MHYQFVYLDITNLSILQTGYAKYMKQLNTTILETEDAYESYCKYNDNKTLISINSHTIYSFPFSYEEASDEALVSRYVNNKDETAFNKIAKRYNDMILGFAMKRIKNVQDAEEVRQDVFLILATKLHTFKGNSKFSTWLYRVTINTCFKYLDYNKKKINKEINLDEVYSNVPTTCSNWKKHPDEIALLKERINIISNAANELSQSNREIFNLKDIKGCSNAEVGEITGRSVSAVKSRVLRTRLALKEKISDYFEKF